MSGKSRADEPTPRILVREGGEWMEISLMLVEDGDIIQMMSSGGQRLVNVNGESIFRVARRPSMKIVPLSALETEGLA